ncbi:MAG TPA: 4Fe-4S binding protein [Spirochaetota bacterium]|nr:4Fe-4S binding protein [Spirochaetota bacterium]HPI88814.1 4Fe-4S binding protein [Spirochaetota bacterium]HPR47698.1 4Fe-4S binding protein [Spirochaetota bacterium]
MNMKYRLKNWQDVPLGGVIPEGGNAADYETGTWRTWKPVWKEDECINCLTCWVFCPEDAFILKETVTPKGKKKKAIKEINYFHCKGCGLCVRECPVNKKGVKKPLVMVHDTM